MNEELKHTENDSDIGENRRFDWSNDSYLFMQIPKKPQCFSEKLPSCLQLHPVLDSLEHLDGPAKSHKETTIHNETISGIIV